MWQLCFPSHLPALRHALTAFHWTLHKPLLHAIRLICLHQKNCACLTWSAPLQVYEANRAEYVDGSVNCVICELESDQVMIIMAK